MTPSEISVGETLLLISFDIRLLPSHYILLHNGQALYVLRRSAYRRKKATQPAPVLPSCNFDPSVNSQRACWFLVSCHWRNGDILSLLTAGRISSSGCLRGTLQWALASALLGMIAVGSSREQKSRYVRVRVLVLFFLMCKGCFLSSWDKRIANRLEIASRRISIGGLPEAWCKNVVGVVLYTGKIARRAMFWIMSNFFASARDCWRIFEGGHHASAP